MENPQAHRDVVVEVREYHQIRGTLTGPLPSWEIAEHQRRQGDLPSSSSSSSSGPINPENSTPEESNTLDNSKSKIRQLDPARLASLNAALFHNANPPQRSQTESGTKNPQHGSIPAPIISIPGLSTSDNSASSENVTISEMETEGSPKNVNYAKLEVEEPPSDKSQPRNSRLMIGVAAVATFIILICVLFALLFGVILGTLFVIQNLEWTAPADEILDDSITHMFDSATGVLTLSPQTLPNDKLSKLIFTISGQEQIIFSNAQRKKDLETNSFSAQRSTYDMGSPHIETPSKIRVFEGSLLNEFIGVKSNTTCQITVLILLSTNQSNSQFTRNSVEISVQCLVDLKWSPFEYLPFFSSFSKEMFWIESLSFTASSTLIVSSANFSIRNPVSENDTSFSLISPGVTILATDLKLQMSGLLFLRPLNQLLFKDSVPDDNATLTIPAMRLTFPSSMQIGDAEIAFALDQCGGVHIGFGDNSSNVLLGNGPGIILVVRGIDLKPSKVALSFRSPVIVQDLFAGDDQQDLEFFIEAIWQSGDPTFLTLSGSLFGQWSPFSSLRSSSSGFWDLSIANASIVSRISLFSNGLPPRLETIDMNGKVSFSFARNTGSVDLLCKIHGRDILVLGTDIMMNGEGLTLINNLISLFRSDIDVSPSLSSDLLTFPKISDGKNASTLAVGISTAEFTISNGRKLRRGLNILINGIQVVQDGLYEQGLTTLFGSSFDATTSVLDLVTVVPLFIPTFEQSSNTTWELQLYPRMEIDLSTFAQLDTIGITARATHIPNVGTELAIGASANLKIFFAENPPVEFSVGGVFEHQQDISSVFFEGQLTSEWPTPFGVRWLSIDSGSVNARMSSSKISTVGSFLNVDLDLGFDFDGDSTTPPSVVNMEARFGNGSTSPNPRTQLALAARNVDIGQACSQFVGNGLSGTVDAFLTNFEFEETLLGQNVNVFKGFNVFGRNLNVRPAPPHGPDSGTIGSLLRWISNAISLVSFDVDAHLPILGTSEASWMILLKANQNISVLENKASMTGISFLIQFDDHKKSLRLEAHTQISIVLWNDTAIHLAIDGSYVSNRQVLSLTGKFVDVIRPFNWDFLSISNTMIEAEFGAGPTRKFKLVSTATFSFPFEQAQSVQVSGQIDENGMFISASGLTINIPRLICNLLNLEQCQTNQYLRQLVSDSTVFTNVIVSTGFGYLSDGSRYGRGVTFSADCNLVGTSLLEALGSVFGDQFNFDDPESPIRKPRFLFASTVPVFDVASGDLNDFEIFVAVLPQSTEEALFYITDNVWFSAFEAGITPFRSLGPRFSFSAQFSIRFNEAPDVVKFRLSGALDPGTGCLLGGSMIGTWTNALGVKGLAIRDAALEIGINVGPSLTQFGLIGTVMLGQVAVSLGARYSADFKDMLFWAHISNLNMQELVDFYNSLQSDPQHRISYDRLPDVDIDIRNIDLSIAPRAGTIQGIPYEKGFRFSCDISMIGVDVRSLIAIKETANIPDIVLGFSVNASEVNEAVRSWVESTMNLIYPLPKNDSCDILKDPIHCILPEAWELFTNLLSSVGIRVLGEIVTVDQVSMEEYSFSEIASLPPRFPVVSLTIRFLNGQVRTFDTRVDLPISNLAQLGHVLDEIFSLRDFLPTCILDSHCQNGKQCDHSSFPWHCV